MRIERKLSTDLGEEVVLYIEQPTASRHKDEFSCKIGLESVSINKNEIIYGIDPMQALLLSIRHLSSFVERNSEAIHPRRLVWELGEEEDEFGLLI